MVKRASSSTSDWAVYLAYNRAAELGLPAPTCDELCDLLDSGDGGPVVATTVNITRRLEKRGLIHVRRYQRYHEVQIVATGKWTADAPCRTPHWRTRLTVSNVAPPAQRNLFDCLDPANPVTVRSR